MSTPVHDQAGADALRSRVSRAWEHVAVEGLLAADAFADARQEAETLRRVAREDLGLARVLDGHRNALDRLLHHRPADVAESERRAAAAGERALGTWGADPGPGEGEPARLVEEAGGLVVRGVKTFCSGAGLVDHALLLVRTSAGGPPNSLVYVDLDDRHVDVDVDWFSAPALRTSLSHRVVLRDAPVLAILGRPGALAEEPWISHDALRTAATWVGALEAVVDGALQFAARRESTDADAVVAAGLQRARWTSVLVLENALEAVDVARALDAGSAERERATRASRLARLEIAARGEEVIADSAALAGSRPLAAGAAWTRSRADLDLLLRQHRLTATAAAAGRAAFAEIRA